MSTVEEQSVSRKEEEEERAKRTIVHEEGVVGTRSDDADLDAVLGVPSGETVENVDVVARIEVVDRPLAVDLERVLVHLDVDSSPPDIVLRGLLVDDTLVLGRTAGLLAGEVDQSSRVGDDGSLVLDRIFVELSDGGVALPYGKEESGRESGKKRGRKGQTLRWILSMSKPASENIERSLPRRP
jgi:hypothetical protein